MADAEAACAREIVRGWSANQRVTTLLLETLTEEDLSARHGSGKTVRGVFGHLHDIRLMWLDTYPELRESLTTLGSHTTATQAELQDQLDASSTAIGEMLSQAARGGQVKGSAGAVSLLAYLVAHEAHHRAHALMTLRLCGRHIPAAMNQMQWDEWRKEGTG